MRHCVKFLALVAILGARSGLAADGSGLELGIHLGPGMTDGAFSFAYGFSVDYNLSANVGFGLRYTAMNFGIPGSFLSGYSATSSVTLLLAEGVYTFTSFLPRAFLAGRAGLVMNSYSLVGSLVDLTGGVTNLGLGLGAGYNLPLGSNFVLSPQAEFTLDAAAGAFCVNLLARLGYKF